MKKGRRGILGKGKRKEHLIYGKARHVLPLFRFSVAGEQTIEKWRE